MKEIDSTARVEQRTRQKDEKTETKPAGPTSPSRRFEKIITVGSETGVGDGLWTRTSIMMSRYNWLPAAGLSTAVNLQTPARARVSL